MPPELTEGTRIYRPFHLDEAERGGKVVLDNPVMQHFDDGTVMVRAVPDPQGAAGWLAVDWEAGGGRVCVCDEEIPPDWTYFEVFFADVNFVAVSPVAGDPEELQPGSLKR